MSGSTALETMSLHYTLESMSFAGSLNIDIHSCLEDGIESDFLPQYILGRINYPEFTNMVESDRTCLGRMSSRRLVDTGSLFLDESNLDGIISVRLFTFNLQYLAGTSLNDRYRHNISQFVKDPGHSNFFP